MRFLFLIVFVFSVCIGLHARAAELTPAQDADAGAVKVKPLPAPSITRFNSVVSKKPPVVASMGQALTADGTGKTVWANVLGTAIDSSPASSGMVLTADGNGGANWNVIVGSIVSLVGDVTGTPSATVVSTVGGVTAANVASGANLANAATTAATPDTLVKRDGSGNIPGILSTFADFYALMPGDNAATVAPGTAVQFPQTGPISNISRSSTTQFVLPNIGTYQVNFQVSVSEAGQLVVGLDSGAGPVEQAYTVVGRATGTSQIAGTCLVSTSVVNSVLTIRNPSGNSTALTITPLAGGTHSVSAHLVILQIK